MPIVLNSPLENPLRAELERVHFLYIRHEECPGKIKLRGELQELCEKWLSCMPHGGKFILHELPSIMRNSLLGCHANANQEIALDDVANAFLALAKYAANLAVQPWRQEFRTVKCYGGYFLQEVLLVVSNIDALMAYIGFERTDINTFTLNIDFTPTEILERLPRIALDFLLVATECQLMSRIMAAVNISEISINLGKLLEYREFHIGSWEVTVQGLMYEARFYNFSRLKQPNMEMMSQSQLLGSQHTHPPPPMGLPWDNLGHPFPYVPVPDNRPPPPQGLVVKLGDAVPYNPDNRPPPSMGLMDNLGHPFPYVPVPDKLPPPPRGLMVKLGEAVPHNPDNRPPPPQGLMVKLGEAVPHNPDNRPPPPQGLVINMAEAIPRNQVVDLHDTFLSYIGDFCPEATEHCSHSNLIPPGRTAYDRLPASSNEKLDMYLNTAVPQSLAEPLMPQQVKWQFHRESNTAFSQVPRSQCISNATEPRMSSANKRVTNPRDDIFYSDEEEIQEESFIDSAPELAGSESHHHYTASKDKSRGDTKNRFQLSWSQIGEEQLLAHTNPESHKKSHTHNGANLMPTKAQAKEIQTPVKSKGEKRSSQTTKSADSRDESWEYVFSKLEIQSPIANQEPETSQDREKVVKTVAALQLSAPPQLLETAQVIYNRPNELDNRRYQEFLRSAPKIDGVVQHPIVNMSWPERYKYLYYRGEREALVGYTELLAAGESSKAAPTSFLASEDNNTWSCQTCTWVNTEAKTICSMCNKSKNVPTAAEPPNPGPQCVQCTLVNPPGRDYCEACGASLDLLYI